MEHQKHFINRLLNQHETSMDIIFKLMTIGGIQNDQHLVLQYNDILKIKAYDL